MWTGHCKWDLWWLLHQHTGWLLFSLIAGQQSPKNSNVTKSTGVKNNQVPTFHVEKLAPKAAVAASTHRLIVNFQGNNSPVKILMLEKIIMQDHKMHLAGLKQKW